MVHREIRAYALKLSPQEQLVAAFGLVTLNPPPCKASLKSNSDPVTYNALFGSTTTRMPEDSTRISRLAGASCKSILYCNPEHPPPITATRNTPLGRPCFVSSVLTRCAALGDTLIKRSSPTR